MTETQATLCTIAKRVVWWKPPEEVVANRTDFLCRVMTLGLWSDTVFVAGVFGESALRDALEHAPIGIFDKASWHYWHYRFGYKTVPSLPKRNLP